VSAVRGFRIRPELQELFLALLSVEQSFRLLRRHLPSRDGLLLRRLVLGPVPGLVLVLRLIGRLFRLRLGFLLLCILLLLLLLRFLILRRLLPLVLSGLVRLRLRWLRWLFLRQQTSQRLKLRIVRENTQSCLDLICGL